MSLVKEAVNESDDYQEDPVINAVAKFNGSYKNTHYAKEPPIKLGAGVLHVVTFKGQDGNFYVNYVYTKKGEGPQVYQDLPRLVAEKSRGMIPVWDIEWIRTVAMFAVVILLLIAAVGTSFSSDGTTFTAFMSAFTAALGYLAGKSAKTDA